MTNAVFQQNSEVRRGAPDATPVWMQRFSVTKMPEILQMENGHLRRSPATKADATVRPARLMESLFLFIA